MVAYLAARSVPLKAAALEKQTAVRSAVCLDCLKVRKKAVSSEQYSAGSRVSKSAVCSAARKAPRKVEAMVFPWAVLKEILMGKY
jgi:hypothetical protein